MRLKLIMPQACLWIPWNWLHSNYSGSQAYMDCLFTWYFS